MRVGEITRFLHELKASPYFIELLLRRSDLHSSIEAAHSTHLCACMHTKAGLIESVLVES